MTSMVDWLEESDRSNWPSNIAVGNNTVVSGEQLWRRYFSAQRPGLKIGNHSTIIGAQFALGKGGTVSIGDYCYFTNPVILCEVSIEIGSYVVIGWNTTIADSDFHPVDPASRIQDAIALSPIDSGLHRSPFQTRPVVIEDDVWIGPGATILKGVHIGKGAWIEPGSVVLRDVPARSRAMGNPARLVDDA